MDKTNKGTEPRFEGANWDTSTVKVKMNGRGKSLSRKVLTKDIKRLYLGAMLGRAMELLRQGYEVRLCDGKSEDAIRIFPLASTDCRTMSPKAQAMGSFVKCLSDKKLRIRHDGKDISYERFCEMRDEQERRYHAPDPAFDSVTPDITVKCPQCGYRFRVGRSMKE